MKVVITKFLNLVQILLVSFLVFDYFCVIEFSVEIRHIIMFLTLIMMIVVCVSEIYEGDGKFAKFFGVSTLLFLIAGGIIATMENQLNALIVLCLIATSIMCLMRVTVLG